MGDIRGLFIFFGIAALAAAIGALIYRKLHPVTEEFERKRVSRALRRFAAPRGFRVIDNPTLVFDGMSGWADHILVGYFGILLVYDLCYGGEYYGDLTAERWTIGNEGKRYAIDNPRLHAGKCEGRVLNLCKAAGVKVPVEQVAVVTVDGKKTILCIKSDEVIKLRNLRGYLSKARFDEDKGIDIEKITEMLKNAAK